MKLQTGLRFARQRGLRIIPCGPRQIQIDIDRAADLHVYSYHRRMLDRAGLTRGWRTRIRRSLTPGHCHITITMPRRLPLMSRVALACVLGSDRTRETLDYIRTRKRSRLPVVFFEKRR